jgi:ABC-type transporter Mla MlaB component
MFHPSPHALSHWAVPPRARQLRAAIDLPSRLDVHEVDALLAEIERVLEGGAEFVELDGRLVKHVDIAGLTALHQVRDLVVSRRACFALMPSTTLQVVAELTGSDLLVLTDVRTGTEALVAA